MNNAEGKEDQDEVTSIQEGVEDCSDSLATSGDILHSQHSAASLQRRATSHTKRHRPFRARGKQFALTYPQCPIPRADFDTLFKLKFSPAEFASAREEHKDGSHHLHVYVSFSKSKDVRSARYFDVAFEGTTYHANTQRCKNRRAWLEYISKGTDHGVQELLSTDGFDPLQHPLGKRKQKYQDWLWSKHYKQLQQLKPIEFPIKLIS